VGKAVQLAESAQRELDTLSLDELRSVCELIDEDVFEVLTLEGAVYSRNHVGGTSPDQVRQAVAEARQALAGR
jgi:argininosuccinate lyase